MGRAMVATHLGSVRTGRVSLEVLERKEIGGFSNPDKMPWLCWSIPASRCHTGSKLREVPGSVCSDCYALSGRYRCDNVGAALERRFRKLQHLERWARRMAVAIRRRWDSLRDKSKGYFRWHDAGDIQSAEHLAAIVRIARAVPEVRFWLPTREYAFVREWQRDGGVCPPNLVIRLSGHMVDGPAPTAVGLPVSSVHTDVAHYPDAHHCPAYNQGGKCRDCRACWDPEVSHVSYPLH